MEAGWALLTVALFRLEFILSGSQLSHVSSWRSLWVAIIGVVGRALPFNLPAGWAALERETE